MAKHGKTHNGRPAMLSVQIDGVYVTENELVKRAGQKEIAQERIATPEDVIYAFSDWWNEWLNNRA